MGKLLLVLLIGVVAWLVADRIALAPDVGTRVEGRSVVLDGKDTEHRYHRIGAYAETFMLFGGDATQRANSPTHAILAGLPIATAKAIAASHPDFYMCRSPGAEQAKRWVESLSFVAADGKALAGLREASDLFQERLRSGGERTCVRVEGAQLLFDSAKFTQSGEDLSPKLRPLLERSKLVLAERVEIQDCQRLLQ